MKGLKKLFYYVLALTIVFSFSSNSIFASTNTKSVNVNDYPTNSRERFVASLAVKNNITYEQADVLESQTAATLIKSRAGDEYVRYKTVDKLAGTVTSGNYKQNINIATEVRYVWNRVSSTLVNLESIGAPLLYLPGISTTSTVIQSGGFNIEKQSLSARISNTASLSYTVFTGVTVSVGGDILSISSSTDGLRLSTKAKTYVINVVSSDLY